MSLPIKTGVLAFGMSGRVFHAPFLNIHPGFEFSAVTERTKKAAHEIYPGVKSYDTIEALIADKNLELIVVNTPNFTHYDYAKQALKAGKHVLIEKPLAASSQEVKELFTLAEQANKKLLVYQNRRFDIDFLMVKQVLESNRLGTLHEVTIRYDRYRKEIGKKFFKEEPYPASGLSYDLGPHLIDQAISLFGKPLHYHKTLSKNRPGTQTDDYFFIHLQYHNGLNVYLYASMLVANPQPAFVINGLNGTFTKPRGDVQEAQLLAGMQPDHEDFGIEKEGTQGQLTLIDETGQAITETIPSLKGNYMQLFENVYQSIKYNTPYPVSEVQQQWQLEILES